MSHTPGSYGNPRYHSERARAETDYAERMEKKKDELVDAALALPIAVRTTPAWENFQNYLAGFNGTRDANALSEMQYILNNALKRAAEDQ